MFKLIIINFKCNIYLQINLLNKQYSLLQWYNFPLSCLLLPRLCLKPFKSHPPWPLLTQPTAFASTISFLAFTVFLACGNLSSESGCSCANQPWMASFIGLTASLTAVVYAVGFERCSNVPSLGLQSLLKGEI